VYRVSVVDRRFVRSAIRNMFWRRRLERPDQRMKDHYIDAGGVPAAMRLTNCEARELRLLPWMSTKTTSRSCRAQTGDAGDALVCAGRPASPDCSILDQLVWLMPGA